VLVTEQACEARRKLGVVPRKTPDRFESVVSLNGVHVFRGSMGTGVRQDGDDLRRDKMLPAGLRSFAA
jgi:hypothetical protein